MRRTFKKRLWLGVAVVAVLAGVTAAAVMAAQPAAKHRGAHHHKHGLLAAASSYLDLSPTQLKSKLQSGKSLAEIAGASSGKSAAGLIAALETADKQRLTAATASLSARITAKVDRPGGGSPTVHAAASYLGLRVSQLHSQLRSGKTLAQLASATSGKSTAGLIDAVIAARKAQLSAEVQAGTITQAQEQAKLPKLGSRVSTRVNLTQPKHHSKAKTAARRRRAHAGATGAGAGASG